MSGSICPVSVIPPADFRGLWQVIYEVMVVALCPSEKWALTMAAALLKQEWENK